MLNLAYKLEDELIVGSEVYKLNLSFDNVIRLFDMLNSSDLEDYQKPHFALLMLTGESFEKYSIEDVELFLKEIIKEHIKNEEFNSVEYDLAGNPMPVKEIEEEQEQLYSLKYDSDYIFASFLQAYNIDFMAFPTDSITEPTPSRVDLIALPTESIMLATPCKAD